MLPDRYRYIVIEGPIGVGKTTLARKLADRIGAEQLLEEPQDNPFLRGFYRDSARYAFPTQMFFLLQRVNQVSRLLQKGLFDRPTVADFLLDKDALFARLTLSAEEFALYEMYYRHLAPQPLAPDLVIYLQAPVEALIERVKRRGDPLEKGIGEAYLRRLDQEYTEFFHRYDASPLLIVNSEHLNFVDRPQDFDLLLQRIMNLRSSREFFNRG